MDSDNRNQLNELAMQLFNEAAQKIIKIPGIHAVFMTFVGEDGIPIGASTYAAGHQHGYTVLRAIEGLTSHAGVLANALGEVNEGNHSKGLGGQGKTQDEPNRHKPATDTTPDSTGDAPA